MKDWFTNHVPESLLALFASIVGWLAQRAISKVDAQASELAEQEDRITRLEEQQVKREDIEALREVFEATLTRSLGRIEKRQDELMLELVARSRDRGR